MDIVSRCLLIQTLAMDRHHTIVQSAQKTHIEIMTDSVFVLKTGLESVVTGTLENVILNV
jgi:hypothetical protein